MAKISPILYALTSICIGLVFLYSGYTKLEPIQSFEYTIVQYVHLPWTVSAIIARMLIGIELGVGLLILLNVYGSNKWVLRYSLFIIMLFSIFLVYLWVAYGNNVNCGCFGDNIWMNPTSSLIKNMLLILFIVILYKQHHGIKKRLLNNISPWLFIAITTFPFIAYGFPNEKPNWLNKDRFQLDVTSLYLPEKAHPTPTVNFKEGKHIMAFLSLSCPHCRIAARKIAIMKERNPNIPFYFIIAGKNKYLNSFWKETNAKNIPHTKLDGDSFTKLVGYSWPVIYFVHNGIVEANTSYVALNQSEIEQWLFKADSSSKKSLK